MWNLSENPDLVFADQLTEECLKLYKSLPKKGKPVAEEWTLLSAVAMSLGEKLTVVAMATGTKCLGRNQMSPTGDLVNDSHAEVLARRTFIRYIYDQIREFKETGVSEVILKCDDQNRFEINPKVKFHFYTSHVPCGDASIVPKLETCRKRKSFTMGNKSDRNKRNKIKKEKDQVENGNPCDSKYLSDQSIQEEGEAIDSCSVDYEHEDVVKESLGEVVDIHRTGAKCVSGQDSKSPGALYHTVGVVRTKPGRGDPTASVSCSDKLARWIACGVQGALLSLLLSRPVLLDSVVVGGGGPYSYEAMHRALISRTQPSHCPRLLQSSLVFPNSRYSPGPTARPCPSAILWARVSHKPLEVCVEGRKQGATKSSGANGRLMVCKQELLRRFLLVAGNSYQAMTYKDIKASAMSYYSAWAKAKSALGVWTTKPPELEQFMLLN